MGWYEFQVGDDQLMKLLEIVKSCIRGRNLDLETMKTVPNRHERQEQPVLNIVCVTYFVTSITIPVPQTSDMRHIWGKRCQNSLSDPATPPWLLRRPEIDLTLHSSDKAVTSLEVFKVRFYELCDRFKISIIYRVAQKSKPLPNDPKIVWNRIKACQ